MYLIDDSRNFIELFKTIVSFEVQFGNELQIQVFSQCRADVAAGILQTLQSVLDFLGAPDDAEKNLCVPQVIAQFDPCDGGKPDTRIFQPALDQKRYFLQK